jgi:5-methylthioadenosine/S-adenosylhomocysteine deaminase
VWLSGVEIGILAASKSTVVHNPVSNGFTAAGVMPLPELVDAGVRVALGTDGPGSNTNQDMLAVIKTCVLLHKAVRADPLATTADQALEFAILGGARCLLLGDAVGALEAGRRADVIAVDLSGAHTTPVHDVVSSLVYGANGRDVNLTIVNGVVVFDGQRVLTVDEQAILTEARGRGAGLARKAGVTPRRWAGASTEVDVQPARP